MSYSYSKIAGYQQCPAKYRYENVLKLPREQAAAASRGTDMHAAIEEAINSASIPLGLMHMRHVLEPLIAEGAQAEVKIRIDSNWQPTEDDEPFITGVLDILVDRPPIARVTDWKSGKVRDYNSQLMFYNVLALCRGAQFRLSSAKAVFLDASFRSSKPIELPRASLETAKQKILNQIAIIESDTIFAPNPSYLCSYCSYRKMNGGPCKW